MLELYLNVLNVLYTLQGYKKWKTNGLRSQLRIDVSIFV